MSYFIWKSKSVDYKFYLGRILRVTSYILTSEKTNWQEIVIHTSNIYYWLLSAKSLTNFFMGGKSGLLEEFFASKSVLL